MDPQLAAVLTALATVLVAIAGLVRTVRGYHRAVNGRLDELLELTRQASRAEGRLETSRLDVGKFPTRKPGELPTDELKVR